jgi:hypothetical protein
MIDCCHLRFTALGLEHLITEILPKAHPLGSLAVVIRKMTINWKKFF